jgi:hypoxanthine phosphoribosyltransferase
MLREIKEIIVSIEKINYLHENKKIEKILNQTSPKLPILKILKYKTFKVKDVIYLNQLCENIISNYRALNKKEKQWLKYNYQFAELNLYLKHHIKNCEKYLKRKNDELALKIYINLLFVKNKIEYLKKEYENKVIKELGSVDKELLLLLAQRTFSVYKRKFQKYFKNDLKSFVDQFHRDHRLIGFPDYIISSTVDIISKKEHDYIVCVLRGGLAQTLLFELLGFPKNRIKYVICGRVHGKHAKTKNDLSFKEIGNFKEITGKNILIVDNNLFNGNTIKRVNFELNKRYSPKRTSLVLDYFLPSAAFGKNKINKLLDTLYVAKETTKQLNKREIERIKRSLIKKLSF